MRIEYWSDYVCPFCYIGKTRLDHAIHELGLDGQVEVVLKSFELDRATPLEVGFNAAEHFAYKYRISLEEAQRRIGMISQAGRDEGITDMDYAGTRSTNTMDAHRLSKYADSVGNTRLQELLYHAFFCDHKNIGQHEVLLSIAKEAGLDPDEAADVLHSDRFKAEVREDEMQARLKDVFSVPHFVIDKKTPISGAQSVEEWKQVLKELM